MDQQFMLQIAAYIVTAASTVSVIVWRIRELEKRVEKHNNFMERIVCAEQSLKASWHSIDEIKEALRKIDAKGNRI